MVTVLGLSIVILVAVWVTLCVVSFWQRGLAGDVVRSPARPNHSVLRNAPKHYSPAFTVMIGVRNVSTMMVSTMIFPWISNLMTSRPRMTCQVKVV